MFDRASASYLRAVLFAMRYDRFGVIDVSTNLTWLYPERSRVPRVASLVVTREQGNIDSKIKGHQPSVTVCYDI